MIGSIRGKITWKDEKSAVVEAGGVGYNVNLPESTAGGLEKDGEVFLWVHTHVREDMLDLYGFAEREELAFFEMLLGVPGVGPKGALNVLNIAPVKTLKRAVSSGDLAYLTKISGIGKKTAEKIILELRDKVADGEDKKETSAGMREEIDALEALKSLGYSQQEARDALKKTNSPDTNAKVREALKVLNNHA